MTRIVQYIISSLKMNQAMASASVLFYTFIVTLVHFTLYMKAMHIKEQD